MLEGELRHAAHVPGFARTFETVHEHEFTDCAPGRTLLLDQYFDAIRGGIPALHDKKARRVQPAPSEAGADG
jgi:hypothetical protein